MFTHTGERRTLGFVPNFSMIFIESSCQHAAHHTAHLCYFCRLKRFATTSNLYRHMRNCPRNPRKGEANLPSSAAIVGETPPASGQEPRDGAQRYGADRSTAQFQNPSLASPHDALDSTSNCVLQTQFQLIRFLHHADPDVSINPPYHPTPASILLETRRPPSNEVHGTRRGMRGKQFPVIASRPPYHTTSRAVIPEPNGESLQESSVHNNPYSTYNIASEEDPAQRYAYISDGGSDIPAHRAAAHPLRAGARGGNQASTSPLHVSNAPDRGPNPSRFTYPSTKEVAHEATSYFSVPGNPIIQSSGGQNTL